MADDLRFEHRMSDSDALMWSIEKDPMLRSTITAVMVLDRSPDPDRVRTLIDRGTRLVPRMRQRVRSNPLSIAPPRWEVDPHFDLGYHLRWVRAAGARDVRSVLDLAEPIAMQGFDRARPLWELTVVDGLEGGGAAIILKVHHAITDGVGGLKIALILFELERDAPPPDMPVAPEVHVMGQAERFVDAFSHEQRRNLGIARRSVGSAVATASGVAADPVGSASRVAAAASSVARMLSPATKPMSALMTGRSLSVHFDTLVVPLADAKAAARAAGGRLNDAFVAATADGFRRYHEAMGADVPATLRMSMPINIRNDATADLAGNQFAPARFAIPVTIDDPVERMAALRELVATQRAEPALGMVEPMARVLNQLPTSMSTGLFGSMLKGVDLITSNVPGAPFPIYVAGAMIEGLYALGPMAGAAANITLVSYRDDMMIGVNVDPAAITDPDLFVAGYRDAWDDVLKVAA